MHHAFVVLVIVALSIIVSGVVSVAILIVLVTFTLNLLMKAVHFLLFVIKALGLNP